MSLDGLIKDLWSKTLGGSAPSGAANASGDIGQMVKYLIGNPPISGWKLQGSGYLVMPAAANGISPANSGVAWTNGAWSQVVAATSEADYIFGFIFIPSSIAVATWEADVAIGTGGAGSEVEVSSWAVAFKGSNTSGAFPLEPVLFPVPIPIANATRVAVRVRSSDTGRQPASIRLLYCKQADLTGL